MAMLSPHVLVKYEEGPTDRPATDYHLPHIEVMTQCDTNFPSLTQQRSVPLSLSDRQPQPHRRLQG